MFLVNSGITVKAINPADIAYYKSMGYVEVKGQESTPAPLEQDVQPIAEVIEEKKPAKKKVKNATQ